jgi:O-antigen ligase
MALLPILLAIFVLTSLKPEWGMLFFVFIFPLINSLPYFFGIYEHIPHAPTALILCLVFFWGCLVNNIFKPSPFRYDHRFFRPLIFFSLLILLSGIVTFLRYANFFPVLTDQIREIIVNVNHVRAGGALMSVLFNFFNYITGFLLFFLFFNFLKSQRFIKKMLVLLSFSTLLALGFALCQKYFSPGFGNTPYWVKLNQINSTFKDPNSFGFFLSALLPIILGLFLSTSRRLKVFYLILLMLALLIFPAIGSRSAFLALATSIFAFFLLSLLSSSWPPKKKVLASFSLLFALIFMILFFTVFFKQTILSQRLNWSFSQLSRKENLNAVFTLKLNLWKTAHSMIKDFPLTGVGLGAYIIELPNYLKLENLPYRQTDSAENYFLQIGSELGLIGFFAYLWLLLEIIRQIKTNWRSYLSDNRDKFVVIGMISGIVSIFTNYLFHSYIGGFEAKYLFWSLLAILFAWPEMKPGLLSGKKLKTSFKFGLIIMVIIFASVHLGNSLHSLSLPNQAAKFGWPQNFGLYEPEKDSQNNFFRWTKQAAGMSTENVGPVLVLPVLASYPDIAKKPVQVKIYLADDRFKKRKRLGEIILKQKGQADFESPVARLPEKRIYLVLEMDRVWRPFKYYRAADSRSLGVGLGREWFKYPQNIEVSRIKAVDKLPSALWQGKYKNRLFRNGLSFLDFETRDKTVAIRLWAKGQKAFGVGPYVIIRCDDIIIGKTMLNEEIWAPLVFFFTASPGQHKVSVEFINDFYDLGQDRNVFLGDLEIIYPQ